MAKINVIPLEKKLKRVLEEYSDEECLKYYPELNAESLRNNTLECTKWCHAFVHYLPIIFDPGFNIGLNSFPVRDLSISLTVPFNISVKELRKMITMLPKGFQLELRLTNKVDKDAPKPTEELIGDEEIE